MAEKSCFSGGVGVDNPPGIPSHMTDIYLYSVLNIPIRVTSWLLLQSVLLLDSSQGSNIFPDIYLQYSSLQLAAC